MISERMPPLRTLLSLGGLAFVGALVLWACSSSSTSTTSSTPGNDGGTGASSDAGSSDGGTTEDSATMKPPPVDAGPPMCDASIVECVTIPTMKSPTINVPSACNAPAFDAYSTTDNEQVTAACYDFCVQQNPAYADAGGFVGCNQTPAEQALGTGAFHCVCAP